LRLHVLSDLHIEQADFTPPPVEADVVVLAGDIGVGVAGVEWARQQFPDRPVLYLAGNHEFYGHTLPGLIPRLREAAAGSNVHVMENDELEFSGVRFLGATLWSDFDVAGADRRELSMRISERTVTDYRRPLAPEDTRAVHLASRAWLASALDRPFDGPTVVLTHHVPVVGSDPPASPVLRAIGGAFVSDLSALMGGDRAALWIYGHTHRPADRDQSGTRLLSNPRGYLREAIPEFDPRMVVEV
jgi:predicted phosphodiesterase